jgi:hypothetical protein
MADTLRPQPTTAPRPAIAPADGQLSFSEEFLWRMTRVGVDPVAFLECPLNLSSVVRLRNRLDVAALQRSLDDLVRRHAVLRSRFEEAARRAVRRIDPASHVPLTEIDLRHLSEADQPAAVRDLLSEHVNRVFDLQAGPLLRAALLRLGDEVHVLAITVHHIVFDGESRRVLVRDLAALYGAHASGQEPALTPLAANYDDYVAWQRARLPNDVRQRLTRAWMARLGGTGGELRLPYDRPRANRASGASGIFRFVIPEDEAASLRALSRSSGATLAMTMMGVFAVFLHGITGATDLVVGMPISDRRRVEFEDVIGLFTNVMILRVDLSGRPAFLELVKRVRRSLADAYAQQDLPYGCFVQARADATGKPPAAPFRVTFNFLSGVSEFRLQMPGLEIEDMAIGHPLPALADLSLQVWDKGSSVVCALSYNDALFAPSQVQRFAEQLRQWARTIVAMPQRAIGELVAADPHVVGTAPVENLVRK